MPTIALVDDDRNILTSVSIALEAEGYKIDTYSDGASALDDSALRRLILQSSISRCRAWTAWRRCGGCGSSRSSGDLSPLRKRRWMSGSA